MRLIILLSLLISGFIGNALAEDYERVEMDMATGNTLNATLFEGDGERLIIWIPSERGIQPPVIPFGMNTATEGIDVWAMDLHGSYMVPRNRRSFEEFEHDDMLALLEKAAAESFEQIMIVTSGRGAPFVLDVGRRWQAKHPDSKKLIGFSFFTPHLLDGQPEMGKAAKYLPIAYATNLPVYLIQPEFSTKYARTAEIVGALETGGSKVFTHKMKGITAGYQARPDEDLKEEDFAQRDRLPTLFGNVMKLMSALPYPSGIASFPQTQAPGSSTGGKRSYREPQLHPFKGNPTPPRTILAELNGESFDLASTEGEVVLVNFWATWCGPCVEEIPSLRRLVDRLEGKPFRVVAVNIGEPREVINEFIKEIHVNFPILLDQSGDVVRDWNVYAYPSNFLLDKSGKIRFAYRGALEWDADSIVKTIEDTLSE